MHIFSIDQSVPVLVVVKTAATPGSGIFLAPGEIIASTLLFYITQ